jgi:FtsH-binding integral membrane protein
MAATRCGLPATGVVVDATHVATHSGDLFFHVRVLLGIVIGLAFTLLLRGVARMIEAPGERRVYWVHLVWVASMLLFLVHFWWWQFGLSGLARWRFDEYVYVAGYALLLYLLCALILPERMDRHDGYREYFYSRRHWFFGALALAYLVDFGDTWIKGADYFRSFGAEYVVRNIGYIVACLVAIAIRSPIYHGAFAVVGLLYQLWWIARQFETLR